MRFPAFWASKSVLLMGIFIDHKQDFFVALKSCSAHRFCCICFFLIILFLFSLMKPKQTLVRGPRGGGRPLVTGFY